MDLKKTWSLLCAFLIIAFIAHFTEAIPKKYESERCVFSDNKKL